MFLDKTFSRHKILLGPKVFRPEILLDPKKISNSNFLCTQNCLRPTIFFKPKIFLNQIFLKLFFRIKIFLDPQFFSKKFSRPKIYFGLKFLFFKIFFEPQLFSRSEILLVPEFLDQKFYWFQKKIFKQNFFSDQNFSEPNFFLKIIL